MPTIWESSVVIALRDTQWERAISANKVPGKHVSLSGNFEPGSADAIDEMDGRFLLIEVKGQENDIRQEWARSKNDENNKPFNSPKPVLLKMMNLAIGFESKWTREQNLDLVRASMQCHHFAFWKGLDNANNPNPLGEIMIGPYLSLALTGLDRAGRDMQSSAGFKGAATVNGCLQSLIGCFQPRIRQSKGAHWEDKSYFGVNSLYRGLADLGEIKGPNKTDSIPFGLDGREFKKYLEFLRQGLSGEEMHSVIYSPDSGYFRYVRNFDFLDFLCNPGAQQSLQTVPTPSIYKLD